MNTELTRCGLPLFDSALPVLGPEDRVTRGYFDQVIGVDKLVADPGVDVLLHCKADPDQRGKRLFVNGVWIRGNSFEIDRIEVSEETVVVHVTTQYMPIAYPREADAEVRDRRLV